jgi:hypothetical protein
VATPSPVPAPAAELLPQPAAPVAEPAMPAGPVCGACGNTAVVNWRRRPTEAELAEVIATEQSRREQILLLADPQQPAPVFPPLPSGDDMTRTLYACADHAIGMDTAALIHASSCTAPNEVGQHGCDCTPEPHPKPDLSPEQEEQAAASRLPAHWQPGSD